MMNNLDIVLALIFVGACIGSLGFAINNIADAIKDFNLTFQQLNGEER